MQQSIMQLASLLLKRTLQAGLVLAPIATLAGPLSLDAKAFVLGVDNRVTPDYNWMVSTQRQPIGRLEMQYANGQFGSCSATVIGRNIALTNTHCVRDRSGNIARQIKFFSLQYGANFYTSANVDLVWTGLTYFPGTLADFTRDWAVVRFTTNVGTQTGNYGNLGYSNSVANAGSSAVGRLTDMISYSGDWPTAAAIRPGQVRGRTPGGHFNCSISQMNSGVLLHDCDGTPGSSGSSLSNSGRQVMGLNWGEITWSNGQRINGAVALERFMPAVNTLRNNGAASNTVVPVP